MPDTPLSLSGRPLADAVHLCVDMQRLFGAGSPWRVPWIETVRPMVASLVAARPERTVFTRFIPPQRAGDAPGAWAGYYARWPEVLRARMDPAWLELLPELAAHVPPARVLDKMVYSPWRDGRLHRHLRRRGVTGLIVTGGETEICVNATVLGAIDRGYRVILVEDALCSSSDAGHDAAMTIFRSRFSQQVRTARLDEVLERWPAG